MGVLLRLLRFFMVPILFMMVFPLISDLLRSLLGGKRTTWTTWSGSMGDFFGPNGPGRNFGGGPYGNNSWPGGNQGQGYSGSSNSYGQNSSQQDTYSQGNARRSPFDVLDITPNASPEEIRTRYRALVQKYHPDHFANIDSDFAKLAAQKFQEVQSAYDELRHAGRV